MFKILVVEDDKDLNRSVCAFLNFLGVQHQPSHFQLSAGGNLGPAQECPDTEERDDFEIVTVRGLGYKAVLK